VIEVNNLSYDIGTINVLDGISFKVTEGDILGLIGPNGAGKTSLFSCILGLTNDYNGVIKLFGADIRKNKSMLKNVGYIQQ
jgi:ABC-type multidrug transport system ATPase subunit